MKPEHLNDGVRRHLPLRSAADGGRGAQVPGRPGHRSRRASTTRSSPAAAWSARSASRTSRSSTRTRRSTPGWRSSWGPPSSCWASSPPSSSPSTGGWRRRPASTSRTASFTDPAGFRETNSAFHLFPIEATGNATLIEAYRKLLVQEYMGQVLTPSVDVVGDITQDHLDIVDAFERGDFEAPAADHRRAHRARQGDDAGRHREAGERRTEMIFPVGSTARSWSSPARRRASGRRWPPGRPGRGARSPWWTAPSSSTRSPRSWRARARRPSRSISDLERYLGCVDRDGGGPQPASAAIDILINNVGGTIWAKPYAHYAEPEIEAEIRRSLFPTMWCCRAVLPFMVEQRRRHDRQRVVGGHPRAQPGAVRGGQGRGERTHRVAGLGVRRPRNPGRGHRARGDRGAAAARSPRGTPRRAESTRRRPGTRRSSTRPSPPRCCTATGRWTRRSRRSCSWPRTRRPTSPGRACRSPAVTSGDARNTRERAR